VEKQHRLNYLPLSAMLNTNKKFAMETHQQYVCLILTKFGVFRFIFMKFPITDFTEIHCMGAILIHAGRRKYATKELTGAFRIYAKTPKFSRTAA
jgi:hypothetical protein